jgi:hypothetical protein
MLREILGPDRDEVNREKRIYNIITKRFSKFLSRMCMNSYFIYKQQLPTGWKSKSI